MGQPTHTDAPVISDKSSDTQGLASSQQLLADACTANMSIPDSKLSSVNVDKKVSQDGNAITHFPNGVKFDTGGVAVGIEPPPGGSFGTTDKGNTVVYDSHHKAVAELDANKTLHVHTKNGEYTETKDGKVTFTPSGANCDLSSLHKTGPVSNSKLEDYGISTDGKVTRFPNGIEFNPRTNGVIIPSEHPDWHEDKTTDAAGNVTSRTGYDGNGKVLYVQDGKGIHVPTADGTLSQGTNGAIRFDSNAPAHSAAGALPKVEITDHKKAPTDPLGPECMESRDPLCGLDLGKF